MRTLAAILLVCLVGTAQGAVWHVKKDGSGDFTLIQEAIDAAAAGDTVSIGPGDWQDTHDEELPGGTVTLLAWVPLNRLTLLGAGVDQTTLSVVDGPGNFDSPWGVITDASAVLHVDSIRFENLREAVLANGPGVVVEDCEFRFNYRGLNSWAPDSTRVRRSVFFDNGHVGIVVVRNLGAKDVLVEECTFEEGGIGIDLQSQSSTVRNCTFTRPGVGLQTSLGGQARVDHCRFTGAYNWGVALLDGSSLELLNCRFRSSDGGDVNVSNSSYLTGSGNVLAGGANQTLRVILSATLDFHGNHILNGGGVSVNLGGGAPLVSGQDPLIFDLSGNYWGTTDPAQIDEWIFDMNDNPAVNGIVEYEPFSATPLASEARSFSEFKSLFSGGN